MAITSIETDPTTDRSADPSGAGVSGRPMVEVRGLDHVFDGTREGEEVVALQGIDLLVETGAFVSLIGPSGCGKSTLLRLIGDLLTPTSGAVLVNGKPASEARRDRDYGMVFQAPVLFDWRSVENNVRLPLEITRVGGDESRGRVRSALEAVELGDFNRHSPWQLSGGMQQRVAIARASVLDPALLLMDEPFGALDEMTRERMNMELHRIWERTGRTVVFVTHSIPEAVFLSTQVVVMSARPGRIVDRIDIDLPRERDIDTQESARFFELVTQVRESLRREDQDGADGRRRVAERAGS